MSLPLLQALFLSGFQPRRVALANRDTSPAKAYLTHWIGLVMFGLVFLTRLGRPDNACGGCSLG